MSASISRVQNCVIISISYYFIPSTAASQWK